MKRFIPLLFLLWSGPAAATITCVLPYNLQNNTTADANQVMANYNALVTCFLSAASSGVNSDITSLTALSTPITPAQGGSNVFYGGTSTGSANAQLVASLTPTGYTLTTGYTASFIAGFTNTGAATLSVNSTTAKNIYRPSSSGPVALVAGEIVAGNIVVVRYDGTQYQLIGQSVPSGGFGTLTNLSSGTTTDLGTVGSHNVNITGVTTITSFGSSASTSFPIYRLTFAGILTLTYNATSLIIPGRANITTAANDTATVMYLGSGNWQVLDYSKATGVAIVNPTPLCGANGLVIANNVGTPNTSIDITADSAVMVNPTGNVPVYVTAVSVTINETTTGANGLDTGSLANNTFYHHYLISNGTATAGLSSTSATSPTLPGGYVYLCRLGASKTNGSAIHYGFRQSGATTQYVLGGANLTALPSIASGSLGSSCSTTTPSWSSQTVRGASGVFPIAVPPTATDIQIAAYSGGNGADVVAVAPNSSYAGPGSASDNQAPIAFPGGFGGGQAGWFKLEASAIQVCTAEAARTSVAVFGWRDKVNAN